MSLLRDNDLTAKAVRDMIAEVEGRKPRKKKATPQTTIVYNTVYKSGAAFQCDDQLGNFSAQRNFDTTVTSVLPETRRWRLFVVSIAQKERMRVRQENAQMMEEDLWRRCRDAWHGNFSEAHRWSMLVSRKKRCWMRRPLIGVILSKSAVLMLLA